MKTSSIASSLSFMALGGATLLSTLIVFAPPLRALLPPAPPQSAVPLVAPAAASEIANPAADRDFDMP